jgi:SHAQKYF class myb-like DNA-binding protein
LRNLNNPSPLCTQVDFPECDQYEASLDGAKGLKTGRWTPDEHRKFLHGIANHGRNWDKVAQNILTRTTVQVRSHAQKYFKKLSLIDRKNFNYSEEFQFDSISDLEVMNAARADLRP